MERVLLQVIRWGAGAVQGPLGREGIGRAGASAGEQGARAGWVPSVERSYEQKPVVRG